MADDIITVRPATESLSAQRLPYFVGISEKSAGAKGLSMYLVVVPPGASAEPHCHKDHESAIYVLKGRVETRYGPGLRKSVINDAGDFIFIPPNLPHQPRNLSDSEPALAIVARNDAKEHENVVPYDPAGDAQDGG
ncbi:MAG: cupin domain-containing protein [Burkholderiales bacterium]